MKMVIKIQNLESQILAAHLQQPYLSDWQILSPAHCQRVDSNLHRSLRRVLLHLPSLSQWTRKTLRRTGFGSTWSTSPDYSAPPLASPRLQTVHSHPVLPPGLLRIFPLSFHLGSLLGLRKEREQVIFQNNLYLHNDIRLKNRWVWSVWVSTITVHTKIQNKSSVFISLSNICYIQSLSWDTK